MTPVEQELQRYIETAQSVPLPRGLQESNLELLQQRFGRRRLILNRFVPAVATLALAAGLVIAGVSLHREPETPSTATEIPSAVTASPHPTVTPTPRPTPSATPSASLLIFRTDFTRIGNRLGSLWTTRSIPATTVTPGIGLRSRPGAELVYVYTTSTRKGDVTAVMTFGPKAPGTPESNVGIGSHYTLAQGAFCVVNSSGRLSLGLEGGAPPVSKAVSLSDSATYTLRLSSIGNRFTCTLSTDGATVASMSATLGGARIGGAVAIALSGGGYPVTSVEVDR